MAERKRASAMAVRSPLVFLIALVILLSLGCAGFSDSGPESVAESEAEPYETPKTQTQWLWITPIVGFYGEDFLVAPYRDHAPEAGKIIDYTGGDRAYDGHGGTDFAVPGFDWQDWQVPVVAVAPGVVIEVVDGYPDRETEKDRDRPDNFIQIDHGLGREAYYSHFKKDSILVAKGDRVEAGTRLGFIGSSGNSKWPHVHLGVMENGETLDPYHGPTSLAESRWKNQHPYQTPTHIVDSGFFIESPSLPYPQERLPEVVRGTPNLRVYFVFVAERAGQVRRYELYDPDGVRVNIWQKTAQKDYYFSRDWWWTRQISERVGRWEVRVFHGDTLVATNAVHVVEASGAEQTEIEAVILVDMEPSPARENVPLICKVRIEPRFGPAQGLRRYQYRWTRNGRDFRISTHASRADILPAGSFAVGDQIGCEVTLLVGEAGSLPVGASAIVQSAQ